MKTQITIKNLQKKIPLNPSRITRMVKTILRHEGIAAADLSFVFVTDRAIKVLNKKYLKRSYATDVLAFDLGQGTLCEKKKCPLAGEIIISVETAVKNAKLYHSTLKGEIALYVSHGILHLLGYDDHSRRDIKRMREKEGEILNILQCSPKRPVRC